jgi:hypothetical protein
MQVVEISGRNNARVMRAGVVLTACGLLPVFRSALRETEFASSRTFRLRTGPQRLPGLLGMRVPVSISCIEVKFFPGRTKLAMQGKNPDEIVEGLRAAYTKGELPRRDVVSFAYMWSVDQDLASGPLASACDGVRAVLGSRRRCIPTQVGFAAESCTTSHVVRLWQETLLSATARTSHEEVPSRSRRSGSGKLRDCGRMMGHRMLYIGR